MKVVIFYISLAFVNVAKLLPVRVLYIFSDLIYYILYYVVRYRSKIVYTNLNESFPEKTKAEKKIIAKKFYRHLADIFIEYIILYKSDEKKMEKHLKCINTQVVTDAVDNGRNVVIVTAHYGNWEMPCFVVKNMKNHGEVIAVYKRLHNKYWDKWFIKLRRKFGATLVEMRDIFRYLISNKSKNINSITLLIADQLPKPNEMKYFVNFLNHEGTAVFLGPERLSKAFDSIVFYATVEKTKRGCYEINFTPLCTEPNKTAEHEITDMHVKFLEKIIQQTPEYWMWTHKRWKRTQQNV
ncbi:MAG: lysophospholipid acyltransferase family protein [Prevotellaceae bacterium]|jgi:KDO2-lipid IV(A) lauroyltransferase|nr:lysophospholipid acyltransferase family protein [Prevotellaceae bacterium]